MSALPPDSLLTALNWRYAVKKFDPSKKIAPDLWTTLETAASLSPSSAGISPWKFVVVTDPAVRANLRTVSWNQPQITDASHLVVFSVHATATPAEADRLIARVSQVRGVPIESLEGLKKMVAGTLSKPAAELEPWLTRQVYIALGVFLASAAVLGVDACPMEGFQPEKYDEILGLKALGYKSVVLATAGYRAADDKYATAAKVRYPLDEVVLRV